MSYEFKRGYFASVNGKPVTRKPLSISQTSWAKGYPIGVLWHYTVGCNDDISDTLRAKNFGTTFCVGRDGSIYQYRPLMSPSYHAFGASRYYMGIEHTAYPGRCELTDEQLEASAALAAAIVEWTKKAKGYAIPVKKLPAPVDCTYPPGFLDHRDGASCWNQNGHTDHLYRWTWDEYLTKVREFLAPSILYEVVATKGDKRRRQTFDALKRAWAYGRELLTNGWRIHLRKTEGDH